MTFTVQGSMGRRLQHISPYSVMMKRLGRRAYVHGFMGAVALAAAFFMAQEGSNGAGLVTPAVEQVRQIISLFFLFASAGFGVLSLWFGLRYRYFDRHPERFQEHEDV